MMQTYTGLGRNLDGTVDAESNWWKKIQRYIPIPWLHESFYAESLHLNAFINLAYLTLMLFTTGGNYG